MEKAVIDIFQKNMEYLQKGILKNKGISKRTLEKAKMELGSYVL